MGFSRNVTVNVLVDSLTQVLADQTLAWGTAYEFLPPEDLAAGSGPISAANLPLGLSVDAGSGMVSGTCLQVRQTSDIVFSRAGVADVHVAVGVAVKAGYEPPTEPHFSLYIPAVEALYGWQDTTAGGLANVSADYNDLKNKINAAAADNTATAAVPRFHRITYIGRHLTEHTTKALIYPWLNANNNPYNFILIVGQHATDPFVKTGGVSGQARTIWQGFEWKSSVGAVSLGVNDTGYYKCRIGGWWDGEMADGSGVDGLGRVYANTAFMDVEIAGESRGMAGYAGNIFYADLYCHHLYEDPIFTRIGNLRDHSIYGAGFFAHRYLFSGNHVDGLQTGTSGDGTTYGYKGWMISDYINLATTGGYGGTGMRTQNENTGAVFEKIRVKNAITMLSGWDAWVNRKIGPVAFPDIAADGWIALPAYSLGAAGVRMDLGSPSQYSLSNMIFGGYGTGIAPVPSGVSITNLSFGTATGGNSVTAVFPNLLGGVVYKKRIASTNPVNASKWVPDFFDEACSKASLKAALSARLRRGANWADALNPVSDPAGWGVFGGTEAATIRPVLSGLAVDGGAETCTVTTDQKGYLWWFVSTVDDPATDAFMVTQCQTTDGTWAIGTDANNKCGGHVFAAGPGAITNFIDWSFLAPGTNYYLYVAFENMDGKLSVMSKTAAFQEAA